MVNIIIGFSKQEKCKWITIMQKGTSSEGYGP